MTEEKRTEITVLNDTSKDLVVRRPPTSHKIAPKKMTVEIVRGNRVFLKIWDDNVILLSENIEEKVKG